MRLVAEILRQSSILARFDKMEEKVRANLRGTLETLAIQLQRRVVSKKLSGTPLRRVTGDLARSVSYRIEGDYAIVGANTPYAARLEYGFKGQETVRAHVRRTRAQMAGAKMNVIGRETRASLAKNKGKGATQVRSFSRMANTKEYAYLRSSLAEMRDEIEIKMAESIHKTLSGDKE